MSTDKPVSVTEVPDRTQTTVYTIPGCDVCKDDGKATPAYADAKLSIGPWAYVCKRHFVNYGCSLGTGRGQELVLHPNAS